MLLTGFLFGLGVIGSLIAIAIVIVFWRQLALAALVLVGCAVFFGLAIWADSVKFDDALPAIIGIGSLAAASFAVFRLVGWYDKRKARREAAKRSANGGWAVLKPRPPRRAGTPPQLP